MAPGAKHLANCRNAFDDGQGIPRGSVLGHSALKSPFWNGAMPVSYRWLFAKSLRSVSLTKPWRHHRRNISIIS